jgi:hypothetical protein
MFREFESHDLSADGACCSYALLQLYRYALAGTAKYSTYNLKALTDHFEGGLRVYSFDPYW